MNGLNNALSLCAFLVVMFVASQLAVDIKTGRDWGMDAVAWIGWFIVLVFSMLIARIEQEVKELVDRESEDEVARNPKTTEKYGES